MAKELESLAVANTILQEGFRVGVILNAKMLVHKFEKFVAEAENQGFKLDAEMRYYRDIRATTSSAIHFKVATVAPTFPIEDYLRIAGGVATIYQQADIIAIARKIIMQNIW